MIQFACLISGSAWLLINLWRLFHGSIHSNTLATCPMLAHWNAWINEITNVCCYLLKCSILMTINIQRICMNINRNQTQCGIAEKCAISCMSNSITTFGCNRIGGEKKKHVHLDIILWAATLLKPHYWNHSETNLVIIIDLY